MTIIEQELPFDIPDRLRFVSLGSGSSGNCYMIFNSKEALIVDVGLGTRTLKKRFAEVGISSFPKQTSILVTHDHADHVKSVGSLSHEHSFSVYTTSLVHRGIDKNYSIRHKVDAGLRHYVEVGKQYEIGMFQVTPFAVPHDSEDCVGYKIEACGICFVIATDVGHVTDEIRSAISAANYLVIEANHDEEMLRTGHYSDVLKVRVAGPRGHLCNRDCGEALALNATPQLRHVWLCHLSEENNHPELARKTVEQILRDHGIVAGVDFKLDVLRRKAPSQIYDLTQEGR